MRKNTFQVFLKALLRATANVPQDYFSLPVYGNNRISRERSYCYELYHQIKLLIPADFFYTINAEVNKITHTLVEPVCGPIIPDLIVHMPGTMDKNSNLVIMEVKSLSGVHLHKDSGFFKDIDTMNCMTKIDHGYFKGILLIYGAGEEEYRKKIYDIYLRLCDIQHVLLLFHRSAGTPAEVID